MFSYLYDSSANLLIGQLESRSDILDYLILKTSILIQNKAGVLLTNETLAMYRYQHRMYEVEHDAITRQLKELKQIQQA